MVQQFKSLIQLIQYDYHCDKDETFPLILSLNQSMKKWRKKKKTRDEVISNDAKID